MIRHLGITLVVLIATVLRSGEAVARNASTAGSACVIPAVKATCYGASQLRRVDATFPAGIDPTDIVRRVAHLRFSGALTWAPVGRVSSVMYVYGDAHVLIAHPDDRFPVSPRVLVVVEARGRSLADSPNLTLQHSGWGYVDAVFPHRDMSLDIYGNFRQRVVNRIERDIFAEAQRKRVDAVTQTSSAPR